MKKLFFFSVLFIFVGGIDVNVSAQSLPAKVKSFLKANYPDWEISKGCMDESKSFVSGDFNGDGKTDYAVAISKGSRGYLLALITTGKSFKAFNLRAVDGGDSAPLANLGVFRKGETVPGHLETGRKSFRLKTDAVSDNDCDAYSEVFYWDKSKFSMVVFN